MAAFQAHVGLEMVEAERPDLGDAPKVLGRRFGEGVHGSYNAQKFLKMVRIAHAVKIWI